MNDYNVKLISYPNGSTQIRRYSRPLHMKENSNDYELLSCGQEERLRSDALLWKPYVDGSYFEEGVIYKNGKQYACNPFDNQLSERVYRVKSSEKIKEKKQETNLFHSLNRTKNKIYTYARCVAWEWFVTFTFSPEKVNRYDYTECSRLVRRWLNNQRRNAPDLFYLIVPEQHKDGAWHFHGLLSNTGNMKFSDSGKKDRTGKAIYNMATWSNGFTTATAVTDVHKVAGYIGKYITKDLCSATHGKQRYFVSQNMPEPEVSTFLIDGIRDLTDEEREYLDREFPLDGEISTFHKNLKQRKEFLANIYTPENIKQECERRFWDFVQTMSDSLGQSVQHISSVRHENSFVDVDYIELSNSKDNT